MSTPQSLAEWLAYIETQHVQAIELGLDRLFHVKAALKQQQTCPVIIVGGTNGKGSTCTMLEAIYLAAGYRVGLYTSPHLIDYNERVRINGTPATDAVLCEAFQRVEVARGHAHGQNEQKTSLTYFEFGTLAAWEAFAAAQVEVIILEVGLGGRLDAVNIYEPDCAIVTGVDLDHMDYLGDTREKIGFEKAGIFRRGKPALCGDPQPPATLLAHAAAIGAQLQCIGKDFGYERHAENRQWSWWGQGQASGLNPQGSLQRRNSLAYPALRGQRQLGNASTVLAAVDTLADRLPVAMQEIRVGLQQAVLPGRFQVLPGRPVTVLDVAHNPQAAAVLADNLLDQGFFGRTLAVFGMLRDKDAAAVVAALSGRVDVWFPCTLAGPRGNTAEALASLLPQGAKLSACYSDVRSAYRAAREQAGEDDRIVVFGSFLTVAEVLAATESAQPH